MDRIKTRQERKLGCKMVKCIDVQKEMSEEVLKLIKKNLVKGCWAGCREDLTEGLIRRTWDTTIDTETDL